MSDLVERMVYVGQSKPWWMANAVEMSTDRGRWGGMEAINSEQAIELAGLGKFRVEKRQAGYFSESRNEWYESGDHRMLVRTDTGATLGTCKKTYQEYQPTEGFAFMDRLAAEGELLYHTAGILDGGKKVWMLAQTPFTYDVKRRSGKIDKHYSFINCVLDFTGAGSNVLLPTDVNVVCANTEQYARDLAPVIFRIPHKGDMDAKYEAAALALAEMHSEQDAKRLEDQALADAVMNMEEFISFATTLFLKIEEEEKEIVETKVAQWFADSSKRSQTMLQNKVATATNMFMRGIGNEGVSKYDALQAVTQFFDHDHAAEAKGKVNKAKRDRRVAKGLNSSMDGHGAVTKTRARNMLVRSL